MPRYHMILVKDFNKNLDEKEKFIEYLLSHPGLTNFNLPRFERHGIISGEFTEDFLYEIRLRPEIAAVDGDQTRFLNEKKS